MLSMFRTLHPVFSSEPLSPQRCRSLLSFPIPHHNPPSPPSRVMARCQLPLSRHLAANTIAQSSHHPGPGSCATRQSVLQRTACCNPSNMALTHRGTVRYFALLPCCTGRRSILYCLSHLAPSATGSTACNTLTHARTLRNGSGGTVRELLPPPPPPFHPPYPSLGRNIHPPSSSSRPCGVARPIVPKPASQSVRQFPPSDPCDFSLFLFLFCSSLWIIYRGSPPACYPPSPQQRVGERLTISRK